MPNQSRTIAVLGGTGAEGYGLALRWAHAGERVVIGSRSEERAREAAQRIRDALPDAQVSGAANPQAVSEAEIVVLTVPLAAQIPTIKSVREQLTERAIVIDTTVPLEKAVGGRLSQLLTLWEGSAAERSARYLPEHARAVGAFHCVSASSLTNLEESVHSDVLVCGDDPEARKVASELVGKISGARALDGGPLENSRYAEQLSALLIALNLRHKVSSSGIRFTGFPGLD